MQNNTRSTNSAVDNLLGNKQPSKINDTPNLNQQRTS